MSITLYSNESSYYSMIARLVLAEKDIEYTLHRIDIHDKMEQFAPEYVRIQPSMTVPTLTSADNIYDGSQKILFFANQISSSPDLYSEDNREVIQQWIDLHYTFSIEDLTMGNALRKSPVARFVLSRGLNRASNRCRKLMLLHPELQAAYQQKLQLEDQRRRLILSAENNYTEVRQQALNFCDMLEEALSKHAFVAGDKYSLADVVWTVFLARLCMIGFSQWIKERKYLALYWERMQARASFAHADIWTKMPKRVLLRLMLALLFKS